MVSSWYFFYEPHALATHSLIKNDASLPLASDVLLWKGFLVRANLWTVDRKLRVCRVLVKQMYRQQQRWEKKGENQECSRTSSRTWVLRHLLNMGFLGPCSKSQRRWTFSLHLHWAILLYKIRTLTSRVHWIISRVPSSSRLHGCQAATCISFYSYGHESLPKFAYSEINWVMRYSSGSRRPES